jgi:hypothetical protein
MKKPIVLSLTLLILLTLGTLNTTYGLLTVSGSTQTFGFQNGSYIGFASPMTFATAVDGGATQQIASSNASFVNWMFFQAQGASSVYGFYASGCNITVTNYFANSYLQFSTDGSGIVKVYVGTLGIPTIVAGGTSGVYDNSLAVVTLTITGAVDVRLNFNSGGGVYVVSLSRSGGSPIVGDLIPISLSVLKNGVVFSDYLANVTMDGAVFAQNIQASFSDNESSPITRTFSVSGLFDTDINSTVSFSVTSLSVTWAPTPQSGPAGGNPTPTPISSVTPNPTGPLGTNDFQVSDLNLGTIKPNSTATANLHFKFSGSSYTLQSISLPDPFNSWYVPNGNFTTLVYMLNTAGESSGDVTLSFAVGNDTSQSYSGSFSVTAMDAFGAVHTSTGTINADVSSNSRFDIVGFFRLHPLYLVLIAVVIGVLLVALVLFSKRRRR